jgi:uncharacterized membrane protein (UPF0127 family)
MSEKKSFKTWHFVLIIILIAISIGYRIYGAIWTKATIKIGNQQLYVLVADTPNHRFKGWSDRKDMGKYGGMLFVFPTSDRYAMVMRDMQFSLDIIWLHNNKIVDIAPHLPPEMGVSEEKLVVYKPRTEADLVLEVPAGFMENTGVKIGDTLEIIDKN